MTSPRILVAGIGNVFLRDDGFGVAVVRELLREPLPAGVVAVDYGIRGLHLAYDLLDAPELLVVADLAPLGSCPGTLHLLEPCFEDGEREVGAGEHGLDLTGVFATVRAMGGRLPRIRIVSCEPVDVDEGMGLTETVQRCIEPAAALIRELVVAELTGGGDLEKGRCRS